MLCGTPILSTSYVYACPQQARSAQQSSGDPPHKLRWARRGSPRVRHSSSEGGRILEGSHLGEFGHGRRERGHSDGTSVVCAPIVYLISTIIAASACSAIVLKQYYYYSKDRTLEVLPSPYSCFGIFLPCNEWFVLYCSRSRLPAVSVHPLDKNQYSVYSPEFHNKFVYSMCARPTPTATNTRKSSGQGRVLYFTLMCPLILKCMRILFSARGEYPEYSYVSEEWKRC